jgi:predicted ATP-binding protein involved in virulence
MSRPIAVNSQPLFVFREWRRHRNQSYNEMSARYAPLTNENYFPTAERVMMVNEKNKQAGALKDSEEMTSERANGFRFALSQTYKKFEEAYQAALASGIPKELARCEAAALSLDETIEDLQKLAGHDVKPEDVKFFILGEWRKVTDYYEVMFGGSSTKVGPG